MSYVQHNFYNMYDGKIQRKKKRHTSYRNHFPFVSLLIFFSGFLFLLGTDRFFFCLPFIFGYTSSSFKIYAHRYLLFTFFFFFVFTWRAFLTETEARHFQAKKRPSHNPRMTPVIKSHPWAIYAGWSLCLYTHPTTEQRVFIDDIGL